MKLETYLKENYSETSYKTHKCTINKYLNFAQTKAKTAEYKDILHYIAHLRKNENLTPKTIKHYLSAVKIYYQYLLETGQRNDHPCRELYLKDKISRQIKVDNLYSEETLENYLENCKNDTDEKLKKRNEVIVSLLVYQGLTVAEICNLNVEDINLEKAEIYIKSEDKKESKNIAVKSPTNIIILPLSERRLSKINQIFKSQFFDRLRTKKIHYRKTAGRSKTKRN